MAINKFDTHPSRAAWTASGQINLELSPKPLTITRMAIGQRVTMQNGTVTAFNDPWDRIITNLALIGRGKTYFSVTDMRIFQHFTRFHSGPVAGRRQSYPGNTVTQTHWQFYVIHFGVKPWQVTPNGGVEDNPYDLTGGIPPSDRGNLTLIGNWAAASAMGTNTTTNDAPIAVWFWGVQPETGDTPDLYQPRAIPIWSMQTPTVSATSAQLATQFNIPAGDFLRSMLVMQAAGTNAPRVTFNSATSPVLNSFQIYSQLESREIWTARGFDSNSNDWGPPELLSQLRWNGWPPSEDVANGTVGAIAVSQVADAGLLYWPGYLQANKGNPLFGVDMRGVATGDLQARFGIQNATSATLEMFFAKYQLNPDHPANQGS